MKEIFIITKCKVFFILYLAVCFVYLKLFGIFNSDKRDNIKAQENFNHWKNDRKRKVKK